MQRHTTLDGEARTVSACRYKWSGHGEIAVSILGYELPDLNTHSSRPRKGVRVGRLWYVSSNFCTYVGMYVPPYDSLQHYFLHY